MGFKEIASFVKIEHTLFSLPFVFIGAYMAGDPTIIQLCWILVAAVGARGLAMGLNRIIDKDIDAANPRTAGRHLASGTMSMQTAWALCAVFLVMLLLGAGMLNPLCLYLSPIPVLAFVIYPYLKRFTWLSLVAWSLSRASACWSMGCNYWRNWLLHLVSRSKSFDRSNGLDCRI